MPLNIKQAESTTNINEESKETEEEEVLKIKSSQLPLMNQVQKHFQLMTKFSI
jgi:hypothetical protein